MTSPSASASVAAQPATDLTGSSTQIQPTNTQTGADAVPPMDTAADDAADDNNDNDEDDDDGTDEEMTEVLMLTGDAKCFTCKKDKIKECEVDVMDKGKKFRCRRCKNLKKTGCLPRLTNKQAALNQKKRVLYIKDLEKNGDVVGNVKTDSGASFALQNNNNLLLNKREVEIKNTCRRLAKIAKVAKSVSREGSSIRALVSISEGLIALAKLEDEFSADVDKAYDNLVGRDQAGLSSQRICEIDDDDVLGSPSKRRRKSANKGKDKEKDKGKGKEKEKDSGEPRRSSCQK